MKIQLSNFLETLRFGDSARRPAGPSPLDPLDPAGGPGTFPLRYGWRVERHMVDGDYATWFGQKGVTRSNQDQDLWRSRLVAARVWFFSPCGRNPVGLSEGLVNDTSGQRSRFVYLVRQPSTREAPDL